MHRDDNDMRFALPWLGKIKGTIGVDVIVFARDLTRHGTYLRGLGPSSAAERAGFYKRTTGSWLNASPSAMLKPSAFPGSMPAVVACKKRVNLTPILIFRF
jgi:hypothetical protein